MGPTSRSVLASLVVLISLVAIAVLVHANPAPAASGSAASNLPDDLALVEPQATIHCCGEGAAQACRTECKDMGPGCKGQIGCRAGECVCNCSCP